MSHRRGVQQSVLSLMVRKKYRTPLHRGQTLHLLMKVLNWRSCWMPSLQERKVKPLEGVVYLPKSGNMWSSPLACTNWVCRSGKMKKYQKTGKMPLSCQSSRMEEERTVGTIDVFLFSQQPKRSLLAYSSTDWTSTLFPISCLRLDVVFAVHGRGTVDMIDPLFATVIREVWRA